MATFDGPSRAIYCAQAIMAATDPWGINIRIGLHTGECEFVSGELRGTAVKIVKGVMIYANNREILASNTVKDLIVGSSFRFSERGQQVIEGVTGKWGISAIDR
jgi:class 3 adenylate cyclase